MRSGLTIHPTIFAVSMARLMRGAASSRAERGTHAGPSHLGLRYDPDIACPGEADQERSLEQLSGQSEPGGWLSNAMSSFAGARSYTKRCYHLVLLIRPEAARAHCVVPPGW